MRLNIKKYYFIKKNFLNIFFSLFEQRKFLIFLNKSLKYWTQSSYWYSMSNLMS